MFSRSCGLASRRHSPLPADAVKLRKTESSSYVLMCIPRFAPGMQQYFMRFDIYLPRTSPSPRPGILFFFSFFFPGFWGGVVGWGVCFGGGFFFF